MIPCLFLLQAKKKYEIFAEMVMHEENLIKRFLYILLSQKFR